MASRIDPFVDVLLRERGDQLYLLPEEPVTMLSQGKSRKISKQPLTDSHIYALLVEVAPTESADHIDQRTETQFEYEAQRGWVKVRVVPDGGKLTAVISPMAAGGAATAAPAVTGPRPASRPTPEPLSIPGIAAVTAAADHTATAAPPPGPPASPAASSGARTGASRVTPAPPPQPPPQAPPPSGSGPNGKIDGLLRGLVQSSSSDLHLRAGEPAIFRTHGELQRQPGDPFTPAALEPLLLGIMPERNRTEWKETGDTDFAYEIEGLARFRVNAARDRKGPVAVFRVIPAEVLTTEQLGISKEVQALCYLTKGLVLVTGPTGSGKSTTLSALVDLINRTRTDHILTIEDPIEFVHGNKKCLVTQRQVGLHTEGFKSALRAALREDPDIILVGELRDLETIAIAIETAETGHLVFGTLHTTTAGSTVDRIIDQFPADRQAQIRVMLSESLRGVIAQTLCKKVGGGRVAAREILLTTPAVSNLIREGKTFQIPSIIQTSRKLGMVTLNDALLELVDKKLVEPDEAYMKAVDKTGLLSSFKARGLSTRITEVTPG